MTPELFYRILDRPWVYRAAATILAPGGEEKIVVELTKEIGTIAEASPALDIGCGPASWLSKAGLSPIGIDITSSYIDAYRATGCEGVVGSADKLPFPPDKFGSVWSVGLLHHLTDRVAKGTISEAERVCRPGGVALIFDAVLPRSQLLRPAATAIRALDRGQFMRNEGQLRKLFDSNWHFRRFSYALTGLEMLVCKLLKPK